MDYWRKKPDGRAKHCKQRKHRWRSLFRIGQRTGKLGQNTVHRPEIQFQLVAMKKAFYLLYSTFLILIFASCEKEELPIPAHDPGDVITVQLEMMPDYRYQLFYDLETNTIVSQNLKTDWDLGFEASESGWHVVLNTSRGGAAAKTGTTDFSAVTSSAGAIWQWDVHSGNLDSTAIGDHRGTEEVYIIDRGYDHLGNHTGYRKIIIQEVTNTSYIIRFAQLDGTGDATISIAKDTTLNFIAFSFNTNSTAPIEPPKTDWDLLFTQYVHIFDDPPTPYLVTGVLINRHNVQVAVDNQKDFAEITYDNIQNYTFTTAINAIGYDWKTYDYTSGTFTVSPEKNYIIKTTEGIYYKLHFIDFYNETGDKGAPKFEMQKM